MTGRPRSADLRYRAHLHRPQTSEDGEGGQSVEFVEIATLWIGLAQIGDGQDDSAGRPERHRRWRVACRWRDDVAPGWQLHVQDRVMVVTSVDASDPRRRFTAFIAEERMAL